MPADDVADFRRRLARPLMALSLAYAVLLVWATHHPKPVDFLGPGGPSDKTLHFLAYGLLGLCVAATLVAAGRCDRRSLTFVLLGLVVFAALDEVTQPAFGRNAELLDWVYDIVGLAVGIEEGVELNLLGLSVGIDPKDGALRLPGFGLVGPGRRSGGAPPR